MLTIPFVLAAVCLNGFLSAVNEALSLPLFSDSIFTVMAAAVCGLITGVLTNLLLESINGFPGHYYPFALVNMFTAWVTAIMVRKGQFKHPAGVLWTIMILTLGNAVLGALIVTLLFGGITNLAADNIVRAILFVGKSIFTSALFARILVNFADKGIAVLLTFALYRRLSERDSASL